MYSQQGLRLVGFMAKTQSKLGPHLIRQYPVGLTRHWGGSSALFHHKEGGGDTRPFSISSSTTTTTAAYKNGLQRGSLLDPHTNISILGSCKNAYLPNQSLSANHNNNWLHNSRLYCSKADKKDDKDDDSNGKSLTIFQRFKQAYKQHGKVLVAVHVATSSVWLGCFYYLARSGFDIVPLLESLHVSERILETFKQSGLGDIASAYLMYKVATPARYTVTLAGTNLAIRYFRKTGRMEPVPESSRFRTLYTDSKKYLNIRKKQMKKRQMAKMKRRFNKFNKFNKLKKRSR